MNHFQKHVYGGISEIPQIGPTDIFLILKKKIYIAEK
jgi:hypothetical protein